jgi:hypothetical protein
MGKERVRPCNATKQLAGENRVPPHKPSDRQRLFFDIEKKRGTKLIY